VIDLTEGILSEFAERACHDFEMGDAYYVIECSASDLPERECLCGCGQVFVPGRADKVFFSHDCVKRVSQSRTRKAARKVLTLPRCGERECACGCGVVFTVGPQNLRQKWATDACRQRAMRAAA